MDFKSEERRIINVLYFANKPLSTKEISERTEMAWQTAKNYLEKMNEKGLLETGIKGNTVYWWIRI
jgi:Sugar-specific transcriptional regulator TrmB.